MNDEEKEWKIVKLKFNNLELFVSTDGDTVRVRKAGVLPVSCKLGKISNPAVPELKIKEDTIFTRPEE